MLIDKKNPHSKNKTSNLNSKRVESRFLLNVADGRKTNYRVDSLMERNYMYTFIFIGNQFSLPLITRF